MNDLQQQEDKLAELGVQRGTAAFCTFLDELAAAFNMNRTSPVTPGSKYNTGSAEKQYKPTIYE